MKEFLKFIWERITLRDIPRSAGRSKKVPMNVEAVNLIYGQKGDTEWL